MRPVEHFLSELNKRFQNNEPLEEGIETDRLFIAFSNLVTPHLGLQGAEELFKYWKDSYAAHGAPDYLRLGYIAAFIVNEYDEGSMTLTREDFEEIRDTLSSLADEMHIDTLTTLMAELVSRGMLD